MSEPMIWKEKRQSMRIFIVVVILISLWIPTITEAQFSGIDTEILAGRIARSIHQMPGIHYKNLAISRIKEGAGNLNMNVNDLIDYINVKIVRARRFKVTDRSKLQLILKEQRIQMSEFVTPNEYKALGEILGVQLFVYGSVYRDALVLKAIDVQSSVVAWSSSFALSENNDNYLLLQELGKELVLSLEKDLEAIKQEKVRLISFWNLETPSAFSSEEVIDYLTTALSKNQRLSVIDRENLRQIYQEQKLNQAAFIDQNQARRLGELYGVDAFVYGKISERLDGSYVASLKMMSIYNGVIIWADLLKFTLPEKKESVLINPFEQKSKQRTSAKKNEKISPMVEISKSTFIMGSNDPKYNAAPMRSLEIDAFLMDRYEVTNREYAIFVKRKNHRLPTTWKGGSYPIDKRDHPVVGITWEDARRYCRFVNKRLPTEMEWERAVRGTKGRKFAWVGAGETTGLAITRELGAQGSVSVLGRNKDVTPEGLAHMAGNVREFVADVYRPYDGATNTKNYPLGERVIRGSSWAFSMYEAAGFHRGHSKSNYAWPDVGFRCAKDTPS